MTNEKKQILSEKFISLFPGSFFIHPQEILDRLKSTHGSFLLHSPQYIAKKEISIVDSHIFPPLVQVHRSHSSSLRHPLFILTCNKHDVADRVFIPSFLLPSPRWQEDRQVATLQKFHQLLLIFIRATPTSFITSFLSRGRRDTLSIR